MNKEFVKKIIKSEMLRYEAIKEVLPEALRTRVEAVEKNTGKLIRDIALEMLSENWSGQELSKQGRTDSVDEKSEKLEKAEDKKTVKRVNVDFH